MSVAPYIGLAMLVGPIAFLVILASLDDWRYGAFFTGAFAWVGVAAWLMR